jgi:protoheme IX farnesyltransferase
LVYSAVAIVSGGWFMLEAYKLFRESKQAVVSNPMRLFHGSITHLTILFLAIAVDPLLTF